MEKADFLRLDNLTIGYNVGSLGKDLVKVRVSAMIQNVFVWTKYSGIDPEVFGGIDNNIYPRPRVYTMNINLTF
jgi:iron complex outermembrane receptor protein